MNINQYCAYEDITEGFGVVSKFEDDVMCEYKSDHSYELQLVTLGEMQSQGELKMNDMYDSFYEVEYEYFVFPVDSMHESVSKDEF